MEKTEQKKRTRSQSAKSEEIPKAFYIYDERLHNYHKLLQPKTEHPEQLVPMGRCPEVPDRIINIKNYLEKEQILSKMAPMPLIDDKDKDFNKKLSEYKDKIIKLNHTKEYIEEVQKKCEELEEGYGVFEFQHDIYYSKDSFLAALLCSHAVFSGIMTILNNHNQKRFNPRGYAIIRPPGHHAQCSQAAGFCIFNNIAIAAKIAKQHGKRVCIFDWDIHHGDGTQREFYNDNQVLFVSLHRSDGLTFYPYNQDMSPKFIGDGEGKYLNVNIAWETNREVTDQNRVSNVVSGLSNNEYKYACDQFLFPMVREFKPDIILISCGFDGAIHDMLGWSKLTPMLYAYMTHQLINICPNVLVVQEGGYNLEYIGQHASGVARALIAGPQETYTENLKEIQKHLDISPTKADLDACVYSMEDLLVKKVQSWALQNIHDTVEAHKEGWKCLQK